MSVLDTLEILITADASGLESALKRGTDLVTTSVEKMNDSSVDWTSILSSTISPAIITGIASLFAAAITQTLQYNQAVTQAGSTVGLTTSQMAQFGAQSQVIAGQTGQSANDIDTAMSALYPVFGKNLPDAMQVTSDIASLAASGFGSMADITQAVIPIFEAWGVTTSTQANTVLTALMQAAQSSGVSLGSIADSVTQFQTGFLKAGDGVDQFSDIVQTFGASIVASGGLTQALGMFKSMGDAVGQLNQGGIALGSIAGGVGKLKALVADGNTAQAMKDIAAAVSKMPAYLASSFDVPPDALNGMSSYLKNFGDVQKNLEQMKTSGESITTAFNLSDTAIRQLSEDYQKFLALLTSSGLLTALDNIFKGFNAVLTVITSIEKEWSQFSNSDVGKIVNGVIGNPVGTIFGVLDSAISGLFGGGNNSKLNSALQGTGVGFDNNTLSGIDSEANNSGLITSLISALQTGIKSGQYAQLVNTFNLSVPTGSTGLTASQIATQLYKQFQGTQ